MKVVTIIGNVGSGKTTLSFLLQKQFDLKLLKADELFQTTNPFRDIFLADISRWGLANELWLVKERVKLMRKHLHTYKKHTSLVDSGILMSWVYMHSHFRTKKITKHEWELYEHLFDELTKDLPQDFIVIDLRYSVPTLLKRINKRGRDYEIRQYKDYVKDLEEGLKGLRKKLYKRKVKTIQIQEKDVSDFEKNKKDLEYIIRRVQEYINA